MIAGPVVAIEKKQSIRALEATNFFLADVQTGLGPFLAAYLAGAGWNPGRVGVSPGPDCRQRLAGRARPGSERHAVLIGVDLGQNLSVRVRWRPFSGYLPCVGKSWM
jgi:hypothetical protein